jgi:hypothetical protein
MLTGCGKPSAGSFSALQRHPGAGKTEQHQSCQQRQAHIHRRRHGKSAGAAAGGKAVVVLHDPILRNLAGASVGWQHAVAHETTVSAICKERINNGDHKMIPHTLAAQVFRAGFAGGFSWTAFPAKKAPAAASSASPIQPSSLFILG